MLNLNEVKNNLSHFDQVEIFNIEYDGLNACYNLTLVFSKDLFDLGSERLSITFSAYQV